MILTSQKPKDEILNSLKGGKDVFIVGCGRCATQCNTGDKKAVEEAVVFLKKQNIQTVGCIVLESCCNKQNVLDNLIENQSFKNADIVLTLCCGSGAQNIEQITGKNISAGLNSKSISVVSGDNFNEFCKTCGNCILSAMGGICPKTRCAKGLINGPCGGYVNGRCEADSQKPCVWLLIYAKMKKNGELKNFANSIIF